MADWRRRREDRGGAVSKSKKGFGKRFCAWGRRWLKDDSGIGVVEVILILVVLVGLVIIFKDQIDAIVKNIFKAITSGVSEVIS